MKHSTLVAFSLAVATVSAAQGPSDPVATANVGAAARIEDLVLQGPRLFAKKVEAEDPEILVRVDSVAPHGSAFRYALEVTAFVPGSFDLAAQLVDERGEPASELPSILFKATSLLPQDRITPNDPTIVGSDWFGGYRLAVIAAGAAWIAGLAAILMLGRKKHAPIVESRPDETDEQRLDRLLVEASTGVVPSERRPAVERLVLSCLQHACGLADATPREVGVRLRRDPEAGPLLRRLEEWLHRPAASNGEPPGDEFNALLSDVRDFMRRASSSRPSAEAGAAQMQGAS